MDGPRGWHSRGFLPHIDAGSITQFITWRLADSLPEAVFDAWKIELASKNEREQRIELARRTNEFLDNGHGSCLLRQPIIARIVQQCLLRGNKNLFALHAWVVMPNHVHVILTPCPKISLERIMQVQKGASSHLINQVLKRQGRLWQPEYFDRLIRDESHFYRIIDYIHWNPVKSKLCSDPAHYPWSSASYARWGNSSGGDA